MGNAALLWKPLGTAAQPPRFTPTRYEHAPGPAPVTVDLFLSTFCATGDIEAERVREVAAELGSDLFLREHRADDPLVRASYGVARAIYVNGSEIGWGYEAPREGLR